MSSAELNNERSEPGPNPASHASAPWAASEEKIEETAGYATVTQSFRGDAEKECPTGKSGGSPEQEKPSGKRKRGAPKPFPVLLHELLADKGLQDIITWLPSGKSFVIQSRERLVKEALPKYFKESKYMSFTRKLNRWGFRRCNSDLYPKEIVFYHHLFVRGDLDLCSGMSGARYQAEGSHRGSNEALARMIRPTMPSTSHHTQHRLAFLQPTPLNSYNLMDPPSLTSYDVQRSVVREAENRLQEVRALTMQIDARRRSVALIQTPPGVPSFLQPNALSGYDDLRGTSHHALVRLRENDAATRLEALLLRGRQAEQNERFFRLLGRPYP